MEKDAIKEKKAMKVQEKEVNQAKNEATKCIADEFRAQQVRSDEAEMPCKKSKGGVHCQHQTPLSLTYILITEKKPANVSESVSGNAKLGSSQPQAMGLTTGSTAGKKHKSKPQVGVSTPTQDSEQDPLLPPKKKMKASVETFQPSATTTAKERNNHGTLSNMKRMDNHAKKCPTSDESDDASINANPAYPAKKAKVDKPAALTKAPSIRRTGKISMMLKDAC